MGTPSIDLTRLRGMLGKAANAMDLKGLKAAGDAGEFLTENLLDCIPLGWIKTVQHDNVYSSVLQQTRVARPDYLVRLEDTNFFLDAKNLKPTRKTATDFGFALGATEYSRLVNAENFFAMPIVLTIWDRADDEFTYTWATLSDFKTSIIIEKRPCLEGTFPAADVHKHNL